MSFGHLVIIGLAIRAVYALYRMKFIEKTDMSYTGSCHCGKISFEVTGDFESTMECNCSHCSRKGYLLWFVPRTQLSLKSAEESLSTYTFNKHEIKHHFCGTCGCAPFGFGVNNGVEMAAINVRCLDDVDLTAIKREFVDGRSL